MRPTLAAVVLVGLSVAVAKADDKPTPPPSEPGTVEPQDDWRLTKQIGAQPRKIGIFTYYPNKGGGYTFKRNDHIEFCSLPYMPDTYRVQYPVHLVQKSDNGSYCQMLCSFEVPLGGVLQEAVDEFLSFEEMDDLLVSVESSPSLLGGLGQLEHHGQARASRTAPFRAAVA